MQAISEAPQTEKGHETTQGSPGIPDRAGADRAEARTLVIGLGNPLVSDDSVGLRVAACLKGRLAERSNVDVMEDYWGGLRLMERMIGYRRAIVIDAISVGTTPGTIHHATAANLSTQKSGSAHDVDLPTALAFGRAAGALLPADEDVWLIGIEAADLIHFSDRCTPNVAAAIPNAVLEVIHQLNSLQEGDAQ